MFMRQIAVIIALAGANICVADDYRVQLGASYGRTQYKSFVYDKSTLDFSEVDYKTDQYLLYGQLYFSPVSTDGVPLGAAAFLNQASGVYAFTARTESGPSEAQNGLFYEQKYNQNGLGLELYVPHTILYFAAGYSHFGGDLADAIGSVYYIEAGLTPLKGMVITTGYTEDVDYEPNVDATYVFGIGNNQALNFQLSYDSYDDFDDTYSASVEFYFTRYTSLWFGYYDEGDGENSQRLFVTQFFSERVFGAISVTDEAEEDSYSAYIAVGLRF